MFSRSGSTLLAFVITLFATSSAFAHASVSGPAIAGQTQLLSFGVGHGCALLDTVQVEIAIPKEITTLRVVPSVFGAAEIVQDDAGLITAVRWTKAEARAADDQYYQFAIRVKVPDAVFSTLLFPTKQTCRDAAGEESVQVWDAPPSEGASHDSEDVKPAPAIVVLPARSPGWNKFKAPSRLSDLSVFKDAQIVWVGNAAYSSNATTTELIADDDSVDELKAIEAGAEVWVKY